VAPRYFTPEEANEALAAVRPFAERMVTHRRALAKAEERQVRLVQSVAGNGALRPGELAGAQACVDREAAALTHCVEAIQELGGVVKGLDEGLVDFPARRGDEDVFLCWHLGEREVAYWHGIDDGFAGRRPLPL
jgi:hypothetical protein